MKIFDFYGVCGNAYKLDGKIWEAIEDPSDGYRSYLESIISKEDTGHFTFPKRPFARVSVRPATSFEGWELVDADDGHVWLSVGTDTSDEYYPYFVFSYTPKSKSNEWERFISG